MLDPERVLVLDIERKAPTGQVMAKVFWNKNVGGKTIRVFGGHTSLSRNLLLSGEERRETRNRSRYSESSENQTSRIGFMPEAAYLRKLENERRVTTHRNDDDDE
jgi:hypothetical protein